jgi:hypothetical protein
MMYEAPARDRRSIRAQMTATRRAVAAADEAYVRKALESVRWERRGLLQRLTWEPAS